MSQEKKSTEKDSKGIFGLLAIFALGMACSVSLAFLLADRVSYTKKPVKMGKFQYHSSYFDSPRVLGGEWAFFWKEMLSESKLDLSRSHMRLGNKYHEIPGRLGEVTGHSRLSGQNLGYASYLLEIEVPPEMSRGDIGIMLPVLPLSYKVYYQKKGGVLNELGQVGDLSKSLSNGGLTREAKLVNLGKIESGYLLLEASNYTHSNIRFNSPPVIGSFDVLRSMFRKKTLVENVINGVNISIFILFFLQFFYRKRERSSLFLGILALSFILFNLASSGNLYIFWPGVTEHREVLSMALEFLALSVGAASFLGYSVYSGGMQKNKYLLALLKLGGFFALCAVGLNGVVLSKIGYVFQFYALLCIVLGLVLDLRRGLNEKSARVVVFGHAVLFTAFILDLLSANDLLISLPPVIQYASVIFTLALSQGLAIVNAESFNSAQELSNTLTEEVERQTKTLQDKTFESRNFLRVVTHDVRNPLTVIQGNIEILCGRFDRFEKEAMLPFLKKAQKATFQINDILQHARDMDALIAGKSQLQLTSVNVKECLETIKMNFSQRLDDKNVTLSCPEGLSKELTVLAEPTTLCHNVLANIVSNSIKFSSSGSDIEIRVVEGEDSVMISIADHGIGMPEELQEKLFDPFAKTTRKGTKGEAGTGFGMPIVKTYMDRYEGSVRVSSVTVEDDPEHSGTQFNLHFKKSA